MTALDAEHFTVFMRPETLNRTWVAPLLQSRPVTATYSLPPLAARTAVSVCVASRAPAPRGAGSNAVPGLAVHLKSAPHTELSSRANPGCSSCAEPVAPVGLTVPCTRDVTRRFEGA